MEALADPLFTWGDWPLKVLVWSIVICVVLIVFTWTVARIMRTIKAARDHWRDTTPPKPYPPEKAGTEARVPAKPKPGPKRQAANRLFVGIKLQEGQIHCEKCGHAVSPSGTHMQDEATFMSYNCSNCRHVTTKPLVPPVFPPNTYG